MSDLLPPLPAVVLFATTETARSTFNGAGVKVEFPSGPVAMATAGRSRAAVMGGWQTRLGDTLLVGLAGAEWARGRPGARLHGEAWGRWFSLVATCGASERTCWSRARAGLDFWRDARLGPELVLSTDRAALGVAATKVNIGDWELELSGGLARQWRGRAGAYVSLAIIVRP